MKKPYLTGIGFIAMSIIFIISIVYAYQPEVLTNISYEIVVFFAVVGSMFSIWNMYRRHKLEKKVMKNERR